MWVRTALTSGITSLPSTQIGRFERLRSATCRTARCSVLLIFWPPNILSVQPFRSDWQGRTVGTVPRREMRGRRLPHRCTYVLVFNRRGELFVHLRTPTKDVYPSHWDVAVGGVLAAGETFDRGAARELREELGVEAA